MDVIPGDGYECIDDHQLESINRIVNENVNLVDPKLNSIIWSLREEARYAWEKKREENGFIYLDEDRVLLNHVIEYHNKLRKSVGLPYESLLSNRISNLKTSYKRRAEK